MDTAPPATTYRERSRGKSRSRTRLESKTDYAIGICLLLVVVLLWTTSNFVTQVGSLHCIVSYPSQEQFQDLFEDGYEKPFLYMPSVSCTVLLEHSRNV